MFTPVARIGMQKTIQRVRKLAYPGEVLVNEGVQVYPSDVIAEVTLPNQVCMVQVASGLGVAEHELANYMVREPDEYIYEGDVLAQVDGTFPRLVRSPLNGRFTGLHHGRAVFEIGHRTLQVQAGMIGAVQAVLPEFGAVLSTSGLLMQAIWGNGAVGFGELRILEQTWTRPLEAKMLADVEERQVIAAGFCNDRAVLQALLESDLAGLLLGWLAPDLIAIAQALAIPIILVQGFGSGQPDPSMLAWLLPQAGKQISLNACEVNRLTGARPEAIIPLETETADRPLNTRAELCVGQTVRVFSEQYQGMIGEVTALPEGLTQFENGCHYPAAVVQLHKGEAITVPQHNLVIINAD